MGNEPKEMEDYREYQDIQHKDAIKNLESLRSRIGDENFIKFCIGVIKQCGGQWKTPVEVADLCEKNPKMIYSYVRMYINEIKRRVGNETDVSIDDNLAGWMRAVGDKPKL